MAESTGAGSGVSDSPASERTLSVVVITHNERERIGACLDSVFDACEGLDRYEVVLVDSRSTDGTVEVAREYPTTVLRLPAASTLTPSAGRYVGTAATRGDLVLFVDGDMVLEEGWLEDACRRVRRDDAIGGVDGHLNESDASEDRPTDVLRGVALYDRRALEDAGGFDPHLQAMEDIDVSYRLAAEGYRLLRLADVVANHPVEAEDGERARRWANGYYHGRGELFRKYLSRPGIFARLAYRTRLYLAVYAWLGIGVAGTASEGVSGALAWTAGTAAGLLGVSSVMGSEWTADKLEACGPVLAGIVLGFPGRHPAPTEYPLERVETLQRVEPQTAAVGARAA